AGATWWIGRHTRFGYSGGLIPGLVVLLLSSKIAMHLARPLATAFPEDCVQVRDLALFLMARNPTVIGVGRTTWTRSEAYSVLRRVIIKQIAVTDFDESSHFVDDLKVD